MAIHDRSSPDLQGRKEASMVISPEDIIGFATAAAIALVAIIFGVSWKRASKVHIEADDK